MCECPGLDESGGKGGFFSRLEASGARSRGKGDEDGEKNDGERRSEASDRKGAEKRMEKEKEKEREGKRVGNNVVGAATGSYRWNPMAQSQEFSVFIGNFPSLLQVCSHKNTKGGGGEKGMESRASEQTGQKTRKGGGGGRKRSREKWFAKFRGPRSTRWKKQAQNLRSIVFVHRVFPELRKKKWADEREREKEGGKKKFDESILVLHFEKRTNNARSIWSTNIHLLPLLLHRKLRSFPFDVRNDSLGKFEASCGALCTGSCDPAIVGRKLGANAEVSKETRKGLSPGIRDFVLFERSICKFKERPFLDTTLFPLLLEGKSVSSVS